MDKVKEPGEHDVQRCDDELVLAHDHVPRDVCAHALEQFRSPRDGTAPGLVATAGSFG